MVSRQQNARFVDQKENVFTGIFEWFGPGDVLKRKQVQQEEWHHLELHVRIQVHENENDPKSPEISNEIRQNGHSETLYPGVVVGEAIAESVVENRVFLLCRFLFLA